MKISTTHNLRDAPAVVNAIPTKGQNAMSRAMNTTVRRAQFDLIAEERNVFDRPTPYALGGLRIDTAVPQKLQAAVMVKGKQDAGGGSIPAEYFLKAEIEGGPRRRKRLEVALQRVGAMPAGWFAVPGSAARLDGYGDMSRGQVVQIISFFQAFPAAIGTLKGGGYRENMSAKRKAALLKGTRRQRGFEYFSILPGTKGLKPGIWERVSFVGGKADPRPVLLFVKSSSYKKRLDFYGVANASIERNLQYEFDHELKRELA